MPSAEGRFFVVEVKHEVILDREHRLRPGFQDYVLYECPNDFPARIEILSTADQDVKREPAPSPAAADMHEFRANMPAVHAEEGCIEYVPVIDVSTFGPYQAELGSDTFVVVEKWTSTEALNAHAASAHMKAYAARTADMIETRVIHVLSPV